MTLTDCIDRLPSGAARTLRDIARELELAPDGLSIEEALRAAGARDDDPTRVPLLLAMVQEGGWSPAPAPASTPPKVRRGVVRVIREADPLARAPRCALCSSAIVPRRGDRCAPCTTAESRGIVPDADWSALDRDDPETVAGVSTGMTRATFLTLLRIKIAPERSPGPLMRVCTALLHDPEADPETWRVPTARLATQLARHVWRRTLKLPFADPPVFANEAEWWAEAS